MSVDILHSMRFMFANYTRQASGMLEMSEATTQNALQTGSATLLAGMMKGASDPAGARELYDTLASPAVDSTIWSKLGDIMDDRNRLASTLSAGKNLLNSIFGNRTGGVTQALSEVSGIKASTATSLLGMVAPVMLGALKKHVIEGGLNVSGLASLLAGQAGSLRKVGIDDRITSALGHASLPNLLGTLKPAEPQPQRSDNDARYTRASRRTTRRPSWIPWVVAAGVLALFLGTFLNRSNARRERTAVQVTTAQEARPTAVLSKASVFFDPDQAALRADDEATVTAFAKSVRVNGKTVTLTGYADQTGDAQKNMDLARDRATVVRLALVSQGVPESQIVIKSPEVVSDSGTDEQARRVELSTGE